MEKYHSRTPLFTIEWLKLVTTGLMNSQGPSNEFLVKNVGVKTDVMTSMTGGCNVMIL